VSVPLLWPPGAERSRSPRLPWRLVSGPAQPGVSRIEHRDDLLVSTLCAFVAVLGADLELVEHSRCVSLRLIAR
jgi:hypothetical protein